MHQVNKVDSSDLVLEAVHALANHSEWHIILTRKLQGHTEPQRQKVGGKIKCYAVSMPSNQRPPGINGLADVVRCNRTSTVANHEASQEEGLDRTC